MIFRLLKNTLRSFKNDRTNTIIKSMGLVVGLTIASVVLVYIVNEFSYNRFHANYKKIYRVLNTNSVSDVVWAQSPYELGPELKNSFPEVEASTRFFEINKFSIKKGALALPETNMLCADASLFNLFTFPWLQGSLNDFNKNEKVIVLTKDIANKYFGIQNPIGEAVQVQLGSVSFTFNVIGVIDNIPQNSSIKANVIVPLDFSFKYLREQVISTNGASDFDEDEFKSSWTNSVLFTNYVQLAHNTPVGEFNQKMNQYALQRGVDTSFVSLSLQPLKDVYLKSDDISSSNETEEGNLSLLYILAVIGGVVLLIACINYINISVAQLFSRRRNFAIKNVCGAFKKQLISQLAGEGLLLAVLLFPLIVLLTKLLLPLASLLLEKTVSISITQHVLNVVLIFAVTIVTAVVSALLAAKRVVPSNMLMALSNNDTSNKRVSPSKMLLMFQVFTVMVLSMFVFAIFKQIHYVINKDIGLDVENLLVVNFENNSLAGNYTVLKDALEQNTDVVSVSGAMWVPPTNNDMIITLPNVKEPENMVSVRGLFVDYGFVNTMGIEVLQGEGFSPGNSSGVLVNESAAKMLGLTTVIGEAIGFGPVKGLIKDFNYGSLHSEIPPTIVGLNPGMVRNMIIKTAPGKSLNVISDLKKQWRALSVSEPLQYQFFDQKIQALYASDIRMGKIIVGFSLLALFIALFGLVGLAFFNAGQKTKEIGVRKVNGASVFEIIKLLNHGFLKWIVLAFVLSIPVSIVIANMWLEGFEYKTHLSIWIFMLAGLLVIFISLLTITLQSLKAATRNPVEALRYE